MQSAVFEGMRLTQQFLCHVNRITCVGQHASCITVGFVSHLNLRLDTCFAGCSALLTLLHYMSSDRGHYELDSVN